MILGRREKRKTVSPRHIEGHRNAGAVWIPFTDSAQEAEDMGPIF